MKNKHFDYNFHLFFDNEIDVERINKFLKRCGYPELLIPEEYERGYVRYVKEEDRFYYGTMDVMSEYITAGSVLKELVVKQKFKLKSV